MNDIEIKEIFSAQIEAYKMLLADGLQNDEETLLITPQENIHAAFPTKDTADSFTLGAYLNHVLAGVVSFIRDGEDREKLRHKGILSTMYVSKQFRGLGIARQLLEAIIQRVKENPGIEQINLVVLSGNERAKQLYQKFGFKKYGTERRSIKWNGNYYDEDQMVLHLL